ncbi:hypothetical protein CHUAL_011434 [Chamberlinius hualienensis]
MVSCFVCDSVLWLNLYKMDDIIFYMTLSSAILTILFLITLLRKRGTSDTDENKTEAETVPAVRPVRPAVVQRVGGSRVARRSRLTPSAAPQLSQSQFEDELNRGDIEDYDDNEEEPDEVAKPFIGDKKIGAKKQKKLDMKAERKSQRDQEANEREERQKRNALLEETRKKQEEEEAVEKAKQLEEEKRLQQEKEQREQEEYLKLKATFEIESSGFEEQPLDGESNMLKDFIQHVIDEKVVVLEDLASKFKLKTQEVIDRINSLLESKQLTGVIDDRGKFIYISKEELQAIAKFIRQRGRVTIADLVENSNSLILMAHKQKAVAVDA